MKIYKKSDCKFIDGYIIANDTDIIGVPGEIVNCFNRLESACQLGYFMQNEPKACAGPNINNFHRVSAFDGKFTVDEPETPTIDAEVAKTMKFLSECESVSGVKELNAFIENDIAPILEWADKDFVVDSLEDPIKFDMPMIGNPLEVTPEYIIELARKFEVYKEF